MSTIEPVSQTAVYLVLDITGAARSASAWLNGSN